VLLFGIVRWRVILRTYRRPEARFLWLFIGITLLMYGVVEGNVGTAYRHKMQIVLWLLVVALSRSQGAKRGLGEVVVGDANTGGQGGECQYG
jgi:hypothetical protein